MLFRSVVLQGKTADGAWEELERHAYSEFSNGTLAFTADSTEETRFELGRTYRVGGGVCNKHALYYVNAYGAWDTLVIQGKTDIFDGLTRYTTERVYDNSTPEARGEVNYATEIVRSYRFHTSPLPLAQSLGMHHLLNSPHVLVHDTVTGIVRPLVLTGNNTEHKQRGLNQYTIEARLARNRVRR